MTFQPSPQQRAIFDAIASGEENVIVDAKAGSGKTTTILEGMKYIPRGQALLPPSIVFLAFNKNIAETLKARVPRGVACSTFHALGFRALKDSNIVPRNVKVDGAKCRKILYNVMDYDDEDFRDTLRLIALLKSQVHEVAYEDIDPRDLIEYHGMSFDDAPRAIKAALRVLKTSDDQTDVIDFDDMLHLAVKFNASFDPMDWIFVDEAQDLNAIQHEIVSRVSRQDVTRICAVGDPHQAIYAFRGAHSDSMTLLAKRFGCRWFPLSVSYRCPKAVVREAQRYLANE